MRFGFVGDRRFSSARKTLAEAAGQALADIADRVSGVRLTRLPHVAAVHTAWTTADTWKFVVKQVLVNQ